LYTNVPFKKQGLVLIVTGIIIGLLANVGLTGYLSSLFRGVSATDPLTLILVVFIIMLAGLSACFWPARRATQVDLMANLRNE
jgi:putative ABC transport system permease protein